EHRIQRTALVPAMIQMLLAQPLEDTDLSSLRYVNCGAAPLATETREQWERRVPGSEILEGYGCTESGAVISVKPPGASRPGSRGPSPATRFRSATPTTPTYQWGPTGRSASAPTASWPATGIRPRRLRRPCSVAGCTPATSAAWTPTATCTWWTARRT